MYYESSAIYLDDIRNKTRTPHLAHMIIEEILRHTHRTTTNRDNDNRNLTLEINHYRNTKWWNKTKTTSNHVRSKITDNPTQRTTAQYTSYDKILIAIFGDSWHDLATQHNTPREWIRASRPAIDKYLAPIGIPPNPLTQDGPKVKPNNNQPNTIQRITQLHPNREEDEEAITNECRNETWSPPTPTAQCIRIVIDNQTLANIVNGDAVLTDTKLEPAIQRIIDRTHTWQDLGWHTGTAATPYINWRYREHNKTADRACNQVMDNNHNIHNQITSPPPTQPHNAQSDGGCRYKGTSATGYAIRTHNSNDNTTQLITTAGTLIPHNLNSLTAETIALDQLTARLTTWLTSKQQHDDIHHLQPHPHEAKRTYATTPT